MGNYALLNTLSMVKPEVKNNTNNQASKPHVMGETKKQNSYYKRRPGESAGLNKPPVTPDKNPDQETPCKQFLDKGGNQNSTEKLHKKEKTGMGNELRRGKAERKHNPNQKNNKANQQRIDIELELQAVTLKEEKKQD